jgi:hypothetical protein
MTGIGVHIILIITITVERLMVLIGIGIKLHSAIIKCAIKAIGQPSPENNMVLLKGGNAAVAIVNSNQLSVISLIKNMAVAIVGLAMRIKP